MGSEEEVLLLLLGGEGEAVTSGAFVGGVDDSGDGSGPPPFGEDLHERERDEAIWRLEDQENLLRLAP